jgi:Protein of unknown function (DUF2846)
MGLRLLSMCCVLGMTLLGSGCVSPKLVDVAPTADDQRAKSFEPAPGRAAVYIYRTAGWRGSAVRVPVTVDGRLLGQIANGSFYRVDLAVGEHEVWVGWDKSLAKTFNDPIVSKLVRFPIRAEGGGVYFVRVGQKDEEHVMVDSPAARPELLACCVMVNPAASDSRLFK